ncbi:MAG: serine hydrolase [Dongiaceae bacterium]
MRECAIYVRAVTGLARLLVGAALLTAGSESVYAQSPQFDPSGLDAEKYGAAQGFPIGGPYTYAKPPFVIGSYSHFDSIFPARGVPHPTTVWNFQRAAAEPEIRYQWDGKTQSLDDYLAHIHVTGLLIGKGDTIFVERYRYGRTDRDRFASASMVKTLNAMLLGIALQDGRIQSIDDKAQRYVPTLGSSPYGVSTLRNLLHMASGVASNDRPLLTGLYTLSKNDDAAVLASFRGHAAPAGSVFNYACGDSQTLGMVVRSAVGKPLATYMSEKIWQPIGAEQDASWTIVGSGQEFACFGFNAILRDWGRIGRLLAHDGNWNGRQLIPKQWLIDATTVPKGIAQPPTTVKNVLGYGYQVWIIPGDRRMFALVGAEGQFILVDPASKLFMVQTAVGVDPAGIQGAETISLWRALVQSLGQ